MYRITFGGIIGKYQGAWVDGGGPLSGLGFLGQPNIGNISSCAIGERKTGGGID